MAELTPDQKLAALFTEQAAPARDPLFCAEVMQRVARRRAWARVGAAVPWAMSGGLVAWAMQPVLGPSVESLAQTLVLPGGGADGSGRIGGRQSAGESGENRSEFRCIGRSVEVTQKDDRRIRPRVDGAKRIADLTGPQGGAFRGVVQMGGGDPDRAAVHRHSNRGQGARVLQRPEPHLAGFEHRQASQDGVAVAPRLSRRIHRDEMHEIPAQSPGDVLGLVGQTVVLQHLLQRDDVGVHGAKGGDHQRPPRGPVPHVVPDVECDDGQFSRRLSSRTGGAGSESHGGCRRTQQAATVGHDGLHTDAVHQHSASTSVQRPRRQPIGAAVRGEQAAEHLGPQTLFAESRVGHMRRRHQRSMPGAQRANGLLQPPVKSGDLDRIREIHVGIAEAQLWSRFGGGGGQTQDHQGHNHDDSPCCGRAGIGADVRERPEFCATDAPGRITSSSGFRMSPYEDFTSVRASVGVGHRLL